MARGSSLIRYAHTVGRESALEELSAAVGALTTATACLTALLSAVTIISLVIYAISSAGRSVRQSRASSQARSVALRRVLERNAACVVGSRPALASIQKAVDSKLRGPREVPCSSHGPDATRELLNRAVSRLVLLAGATSVGDQTYEYSGLSEATEHLVEINREYCEQVVGTWPALKGRPYSTPALAQQQLQTRNTKGPFSSDDGTFGRKPMHWSSPSIQEV